MTDRLQWLVTCAVVVVVAFSIGVKLGDRHPGQTLVPTAGGEPSDLPPWACSEIVFLRLEQLRVARLAYRAGRRREGLALRYRLPGRYRACR